MPKQSPTTKERSGTQRLGAVLRQLRLQRGVTTTYLVKTTGLSRSYLSYLEQGHFSEVGLDKFARLIAAMGLSADQVLEEAGYVPPSQEELPEPVAYLRKRYHLSPNSLEMATAFLEFLAARDRRNQRQHDPKPSKASEQ